MPSNRLVAVLFLLPTATASAAVRVSCPLTITVSDDVHPLSGARVYHGPASGKGELMPVHGNFDLGGAAGTGGGGPFNMVCVYSGTKEVQTLALPSDVSSCDITDAGSGTRVGCH